MRSGKKVFGTATVGNVRADAAPSHSLYVTLAESLQWPFWILSYPTSYNVDVTRSIDGPPPAGKAIR